MLRGDLYQPHFAEGNKWGIEILSGDFKGVFVQVEKFNVVKQGIEVDYHIVHKPESITEDLKGELFNSVSNTILDDILKEASEIPSE